MIISVLCSLNKQFWKLDEKEVFIMFLLKQKLIKRLIKKK